MQLTSSDTAQHEREEVLPSILPVYVFTVSFIVDDILILWCHCFDVIMAFFFFHLRSDQL